MNYFIVLETENTGYKIFMEDLTWYIESSAKKAGLTGISPTDQLNAGNIIVLRGDMPLIKPSTIQEIINSHSESGNKCSTSDKSNGIFILSADLYNEISSEINTSSQHTALSYDDFCAHPYIRSSNNNIIPHKKKGELLIVRNTKTLNKATRKIKNRINNRWINKGVNIIDTDNTYIGPRVHIEPGTTIYPGTCLEGNVLIAGMCHIGPYSRIVDSEICEKSTIQNSIVLSSKVGKETSVGPFAYLRPNSFIGDNAKIGDFVEVKNSIIGNYSKASHLSYLGDSDIGEHVNIGCGSITVNYDGDHKNRTIVEDNVFIGCNTNLVAPVKVSRGAFIAAGSTITDEIPEDALAIARARQINKTSWKKK